MNVDVLIVGAGPAGLAAAIELRRRTAGQILVVDRERDPGGVPRHSAHTGYGLRDLHRVMSGPAYARRYAAAAAGAGAQIRTQTTVTGWCGDRVALLTSAGGVETVTARAVLLATGCRERPRPARLVPGGRPSGVMTTGELQQRVHLGGERRPGRAVVVGAEHVSFSAMVTLEHAGADVVALVTDLPRQQSYAAFALAAAARWRVPVWASTAVRQVLGRDRLTAVELADVRTGAVRSVACDTLVFTGNWIPDYELARAAGTAMDPGTRGPLVDTALLTSLPGVFAAGNLVHAAETADIAALSGRHAAAQIAAALSRLPEPGAAEPDSAGRVPIEVEPRLAWISPNAIAFPAGCAAPPPRGRFVLRSHVFARRAGLEVRQGDRVLARTRTRLIPGRSVTLESGWLTRVQPSGGPVRVRVI